MDLLVIPAFPDDYAPTFNQLMRESIFVQMLVVLFLLVARATPGLMGLPGNGVLGNRKGEA